MSGKYSVLSNNEVNKRIDAGEFTVDTYDVVKDSKNRLVRFNKPHKNTNEIRYNNTYVQVVNNYVTYVDIDSIVQSFLSIQNQRIFDDLQESYVTCKNFLEQYKNSNNKEIIKTLNEESVKALSKYQTYLPKYLKNDISNMEKETFIHTLNAYLELIKIFKLSSYLYNKNASDYRDSKRYLDIIHTPLRMFFEEMVCPYSNKRDDITYYDCSNSIYMDLFFNRDIQTLSKYVSVDSRFKSLEDVIGLISTCFKDRYTAENFYGAYKEKPKDIHEFAMKIYEVLHKFQELDNYNEIFSVSNDNPVMIDNRTLKDVLLQIK